jgi:DNA polymerase-4
MERYAELSRAVMSIFAELSPEVSPISIDEAFLDMGGTGLLWGAPEEAALLLKRRVREETGLGVSVGIASNRYVAKIASGIRKPDGLVMVAEGEEESFMLRLPLSRLWGAGEKTQDRFRDLGIFSIADLVSRGESELRRLFGESGGGFLYAAVRGRDLPMFSGRPGSRSMSTETTFEIDVDDLEALESALLEMSYTLFFRLRQEGSSSRTLVLKLRLHDFSTLSRRQSRVRSYEDSKEVFADAISLLGRAWNGKTPVRLIGLGFADLSGPGVAIQAELFKETNRRRKIEEAIMGIGARGFAGLRPARLIGDDRGREGASGGGRGAPRSKKGPQ